jgi:prepilin-type N-terminal cleavage/methylation domain-containing protein
MADKRKIKAFTLAETLVTLALTSILISLAYGGLTQIQRLLFQYNDQNSFIIQFNELEKRLSNLNGQATAITQKQPNTIDFKKDTAIVTVEIFEKAILIKHRQVTDTFNLISKDLKVNHLKMPDQSTSELIDAIEFDVFMQNQKFHLSFRKEYDAASIIHITRKSIKADEFN